MKHIMFVLLFLNLFWVTDVFSQNVSFSERLKFADSCVYWPYKDWDSVVNLGILDTIRGRGVVTYELTGYLVSRKDAALEILTIEDLRPIVINRSNIQTVANVNPDRLFSLMSEKRHGSSWRYDVAKLFAALWLKERQFDSLSKQFDKVYLSDEYRRWILNDFAALYFDEMLQELSLSRNYKGAVAYGEFLSSELFISYEDFETARKLTTQLQGRVEDFVTLKLPDSGTWLNYKKEHSREGQIDYLLQRLKLLNCVQDGQPGGISYSAPQSSVSFETVNKHNENFWEPNRLSVINPVRELINLQISPLEVKQVAPYLLREDYIPSYTYHRDFFQERTLHKVSWVVADIIFATTQQQFFKVREFDTMTVEQKKEVVESIMKWCDSQHGKTRSKITHEILQKSNNWNEFYPALQRAYFSKEPYLAKLLVSRFNDFSDKGYPTEQGVIAQYLFLVDSGNYVDVVKAWMKTDDDWVRYWSSLYLLKNSNVNRAQSLKVLTQVLEKCDGDTFYPEATDELLKLGAGGVTIVEKVLLKPMFEFGMMFDPRRNMIKKLLRAKSEATYTFLYNGMLDSTIVDDKEGVNYMTKSDACTYFVDLLQPESERKFDMRASIQEKKDYAKKLSKWFSANFQAYSKGLKNGLQLDLDPEERIYQFVDAAK